MKFIHAETIQRIMDENSGDYSEAMYDALTGAIDAAADFDPMMKGEWNPKIIYTCSNCSSTVDAAYRHCPACGAAMAVNMPKSVEDTSAATEDVG